MSQSAIAVGSGYRFNENFAIKSGFATNTENFKGAA
ncbi:YadA-like family protein [Pantoea ananatis]|nr:YadA-like family protein [Pantoea ananatis]